MQVVTTRLGNRSATARKPDSKPMKRRAILRERFVRLPSGCRWLQLAPSLLGNACGYNAREYFLCNSTARRKFLDAVLRKEKQTCGYLLRRPEY